MHSSIIEAVKFNSINQGDKKAVVDVHGAYTYLDLYTKANEVASSLEAKGLKAGDNLIVECTQDGRYIIADLACELLGVVFVPIEQNAIVSGVKDIITETNAKGILCLTDYSELATTYLYDDIFVACETKERNMPEASTVTEILYSTGTTGKPKGIMISHMANVAIAENIQAGTEMAEDAVEMIPLPLSHSHGLRTCYANFINGSTVVIIDGVMNLGRFFKMIDEYKVNAFDISPTLAKLLIKVAKSGLNDISSQIKYIELGTAVLEDDVKESLKEIFSDTRLYNFYGSTEAGRSCVYDFNKEDYSKCIGYPSKHAKFFITDENKEEIKSSLENPGLLAVSGKMMMEGYYNAPELTKETVINGVIYTSDLGYIDEAGRVFVFGRADDVINYKGIKIAPEEIESVASKYDGVKDCACVPIKDAICGQVPKLFIEVEGEIDLDAYIVYLKENLELSRVPSKVEIIEQLPRTSNGKLQRKKLREE